MSSSKTTTATRKPSPKASAAPAENSAIGLDQAIAQAQRGRVNVSPDKAVQMAAKLYGEG
jgi:hypothetical protein